MNLRDKLAKKHKDDDVLSMVITCMLEVVMEAVMGLQLQRDDSNDIPYIKAIQTYAAMLAKRLTNPLNRIKLYFNMSTFGKRYYEQIDIMKQFTEEIVQNRVNAMLTDSNFNQDKKRKKAFLDLLINHLRDGKLTQKEIREQIDTITFAAHDTTAAAVTYALYQIGECIVCNGSDTL